MTAKQRQWLIDNGYDPVEFDIDAQGNVIEREVVAEPQREVMSVPRAFGTSFLGSVLPSAAGLAAGAKAGALGGSFAGLPGTVIGAIGGGLVGGYGAGKLQEAALERFAPEVQQELARAQTDQPVASYLGGFAPNVLALRPSFGGIKGLTAPAMGGSREATRTAFMPAAVNVGANVAGATAGQLVDLAQGGEFSGPRFAADVALGSLFSDPTRIGRRLGLQPLTPEAAAPERLDLAGRRVELAAAEAARARETALAEDEAASARATELLGGETKPAESLDEIIDPRAANIEKNRVAIEGALKRIAKENPPEDLVQDLANDPFVGNLRDDPAELQEFILRKADKYLQQAFARAELTPEFTGQMMGAGRERAGAFTPEGGVRVAPADWTPPSERVTRQPATTDEVLGRAPAAEEGTPLEQALKPTPEEVAKAEKIQAENARIEAEQNAAELQKLRDLEAAQALSDEAAARLEALQARQAELLRLAERAPAVIRRGVAEQGAPDIARAKQELADARAIADELVAKLQRAGGEGQITQADLDAAAQLAARRGLKLEFTTPEQQAKGIRGAYLTNEAGERVIYIDANAATPDTAIHEIGHDVFARSAGGRMKRSLMQTAEDSPAFKAEYEARLKEGVSEQRARDLALEEGVIQAFGERYPNVPQGEIRRWFSALKASLKSMVGMRLSPEDAARWLHYATTELVPWKGVAVGKGGEERLQRAQQETPEFKNWFGESQVVDEQGKPLVVYHGTSKDVDFTSFKGNKNGIWFTPDPDTASNYAMQNDSMGYRRGVGYSMEPTNTASRVIPAYVSLKNPARFEVWPDVIRYATNYKKALGDYFTQLKAQGHDGVIFGSGKDTTYVAFNPEQVKSATANRGTFSPESRDIRYQRGEEDATRKFAERVIAPKAREERMQRGENENYQKAVQDFREGYQKRIARGMSHENALKAAASDTEEYVGELGVYQPSTKAVPLDQQSWLNQVFEADAKNWEPAYSKIAGKTYADYFVPGRDSIFHDLSGVTWDKTSPEAAFPNLSQAIEYAAGDAAKLTDLLGEDSALKLLAAYQKSLPKTGKLDISAAEQLLRVQGPDIRYQRSLLSEAKTPAELDYLASKGGPFAEVARSVRNAYNTRDFKQGQWSSKYSLTTKLPEEARVRLLNHLANEFDSGVRSTPAPDLRAAYDQIRKDYLPAIVNDYNSKGFMVRDTAGLRARGSNPTYFPLHAIADAVKDVLTTKQGSPEWDKLKADFINWNTQLKQADGASLAEAQRYAQEKFEDMQNITAQRPGIESGIPFSGARKPEGYPLPPSWRSNDILDILNNYTRRSATDFAYQQHVESSPVAMAALGAKTMLNNQPIPANVLQSTAPVINDPSVQSVLREYRGTPAQKTEGLLQSAGRLTSAATIGTVSKVGDIGTSMFKGLAYLPPSEYAAGLAQFVNKIADFAALKERSYASGLNKRDAAENMRQVLGIAEDSTAFMDKAARVLSKVTFVNELESVARTIAQGWGETIVGINKKLALGGDKNALQMLDTLSPDWRTRSDADLAAQVGRLLQGSYDMRQLPASVLESAAAPYLTWSKWSIGQYDSFVKYAIRPAMQGNMKPLIGQMLIGLLGGGAISAVQEWLNNREGKDITWRELESWMQQNQGEIGSDGGQLLAQKLLTMAQKMGTFGFAGDLVKMTLDALAGGSAQGIATMPAVDAIYDVSKRTAAAIQALDDGEDFGLVMKALMKDSLVGHVQALRVARNWLDEDENLRYDDRRRQRLYDALSGLPSKGGAFSVSYSNLSEREFERGEIGEDTGEEAMSLVSRAREQATTPEDYASRIRKLKTSQNQIMPSLERQPMKAARYLSWLEGAEEGLGSETLRRYMVRRGEDEYRKSLVEGLSGLR